MRIGLRLVLVNSLGWTLFRLIASRVRARGWELVTRHGMEFPLERVRRDEVDVLVARVMSREEEAALAASGVPVVNLASKELTPRFFQVLHDNRDIGGRVATHLWTRGYRRVGVLGCDEWLFSRERIEGFAAAWSGDAIRRLSVEHTKASPEDMAALVADWPELDAVYAVNDWLAANLVLGLPLAGRRVPDDVAVIGTDRDEALSLWVGKELASVLLDEESLADATIRALEKLAKNPRARPYVQRVRALEVFSGETAGPATAPAALWPEVSARLRSDDLRGLCIDALAKAAGLSRRSFERAFRAAHGETAGAAILRARIDLAKRLLMRREATIEMVAEWCGYADRHHFSVRFKAATGQGPAEFRRRLLKLGH